MMDFVLLSTSGCISFPRTAPPKNSFRQRSPPTKPRNPRKHAIMCSLASVACLLPGMSVQLNKFIAQLSFGRQCLQEPIQFCASCSDVGSHEHTNMCVEWSPDSIFI